MKFLQFVPNLKTVVFAVTIVFASTVFADDAQVEPKIPEDLKIRQDLIQITERIVELRTTIKKIEDGKTLKGKSKKEKQDRKAELQKELSELNGNFESIATRVPEEELPQKQDTKLNWSDALTEITKPLLFAIHEISDRPRKIDLLTAKIESLNHQMKRFEIAQEHLGIVSDIKDLKTDKRGVRAAYRDQVKLLQDKYDPKLLQLKLEETKRSLQEIESNDKSIFTMIASTLVDFFRVRGKNLAIAILTFLGVWWLLTWILSLLRNHTPLFHQIRPSQRKVITAFSNIVFLAVSLASGLISLYLQNDWLLLTLLLLVLVGVAWASRQVVPQVIREIRLIMNLGAIRETERVIWKGIPFHVKEIGFYVTLENPALQAASLSLPVGELLPFQSRPEVRCEKWFPTEVGDYVSLSDGTFGQVEMQTVEQVVVKYLGARMFYSTTDFLSMHPRNLSDGFELQVQFGLDYGIQERVCQELPEIFAKELKSMFKAGNESSEIESVEVEFDQAAESSLNLLARVHVRPENGDKFYSLRRLTQRNMVHICNKYDLTIPFNQLTVSMSEEQPLQLSPSKVDASLRN